MIRDISQYHQQTKHHPYRHARALGYMDWETQPDPFRRFTGAPGHRLAFGSEAEGPLWDDIYDPAGQKAQALGKVSVSDLFYYSLALSATKQYMDNQWHLRCNPSSGNLHPTEAYLLAPPLDEIHSDAALYHYAPYEHALERLVDLEEGTSKALFSTLPAESCLVALSSIYWRESWKYGERAFRYCHHDVGHAIAGIALSASLLGWQTRVLEAVGGAEIATLLSIEQQTGVEAEHADCLLALFPADSDVTSPLLDGWRVPERVLAHMKRRPHAYVPNRLSEDHHDWPIIDQASRLSEHPARIGVSSWRPSVTSFEVEPPARRTVSARAIIRSRRSVQAMDGTTEMDGPAFFRTLARLVPTEGRPPFAAWPWQPAVHPVFAVHRVRGLASGLYILVRDPAQIESLQSVMTFDASSSVAEDVLPGLPFYLIKAGDFSDSAENVSCNQAIASGGVFATMMLAWFQGPLEERGAWFYPRLHWEAGMVGQVLYLEAEAQGMRGTGIGCFYDDSIHELLGIRDLRMQSLYNFTVGGAVEDPRLSDLPAYSHLRISE